MAVSRHFEEPAAGRSGNRVRIVDASLDLFNREGVGSVTTNHIAAHLSISPGNLYYHFRNKEEIIRALFPRVVDAAHASLALPDGRPITAEDVGAYHCTGAQSLWGYRFFFRDRAELLARDPLLTRQLHGLHEWLIGRFATLFRRLIAQGDMDLGGFAGDIDRIATNAVVLWTSWVPFLTTTRSRARVEHGDIVEGALCGFLTFAPFLDARFVRAVRAAIDSWDTRDDSTSHPRAPARPRRPGRSRS